MFCNWIKILLTIAFVLSAQALSLRQATRTTTKRKLLRLEEAPYPAAGFKPDIPFELPTETTTESFLQESTTLPYEEIEITTQQTFIPSTYLPPQQPQDVYGPPKQDTSLETENVPDNNSPEVEQLEEEEFESLPQPEATSQNGRLSFGRKLKKPIK